MIFFRQLFGFIFCITLLLSCGNKSGIDLPKNVKDTANFKAILATKNLSKIISTSSGPDYFFEPDTSVITGKLRVVMYYGPPNFGENPKTDSKEYAYIFYPDHSINVIQKSEAEADYEVTTNKVIKFQLVPPSDISLHPLVNKRIKIIGTFFGAHTGHHHTDVLLELTKVEKLK